MENLSNIIEGILFVAGEPVSLMDIAEKLEIETDSRRYLNQAIGSCTEYTLTTR